mmetsp:Transcript_19763/g.54960  ORF Transcript_19763/g.54960 Transcript_19763/m.54960 type:complete len:91 (-) Transcript_19763:81-353(-)
MAESTDKYQGHQLIHQPAMHPPSTPWERSSICCPLDRGSIFVLAVGCQTHDANEGWVNWCVVSAWCGMLCTRRRVDREHNTHRTCRSQKS